MPLSSVACVARTSWLLVYVLDWRREKGKQNVHIPVPLARCSSALMYDERGRSCQHLLRLLKFGFFWHVENGGSASILLKSSGGDLLLSSIPKEVSDQRINFVKGRGFLFGP